MAGSIELVASEPSRTVRIWVAGNYERALEACRLWCERGACVSVSPVDYVYTGGEESGVVVTLINYPRFPQYQEAITAQAVALARHLIEALHQHTASVETPTETLWLSRRPEHVGRVLNQKEIDGLLELDEDAQDPPPPDELTVCRSILRHATGWNDEEVNLALMEEEERLRQMDEGKEGS